MRRLIVTLVAAFVALAVSACSGASDPPTYRYRLTVEVETPEGLKTGSSVIEVKQRLVRPGSDPSSRAVRRRVRGEAVAVDLPGGQTLFALLRSDDDVDWASAVNVDLLAMQGRPYFDAHFEVLSLVGERTLPRTWPRRNGGPLRSAYPMLVMFGDLDDPTTVRSVDPDNLAASFGEDVELRRITVQMTDEPVTTGIEERLAWFSRVATEGGGLVPITRNERGRWQVAPGFDESLASIGLSNFSTEAYE